MNAEDIKTGMLNYCLWRGNYQGAVTEYRGADVFGITKDRHSHEFEIKVSRSDLMRELKSIECIVNGTEPKIDDKDSGKYGKHKIYRK